MKARHKDLITSVIFKENEEARFELYCTSENQN
jgi:hypothetical protein